MKKIKILRLIARLNIGGPSIQAVLLSSELNNSKFSTILVTGVIDEEEGDMSYLANKYGVVPQIIKEMGREIHWYDDFITLFNLIKIIREYKPDIIHTHTAKAGTIGRLAAILTKIPICIHTFHGHVFSGYFSPRKTQFFILIERFLAKFTKKIIAISPIQKYDLAHKYHIKTNEGSISIGDQGMTKVMTTQSRYAGKELVRFNMAQVSQLVEMLGKKGELIITDNENKEMIVQVDSTSVVVCPLPKKDKKEGDKNGK